MKSISCSQLHNLIKEKSILLIDLRERNEFQIKHIKNSINIPYDIFIKDVSRYLNHSYTYYLICNTGFLSKQCALELTKKGYNIISINGGIDKYNYI